MKERPILFSAPMVCALLDGSKTQTRRVVKPQPTYSGFTEIEAGVALQKMLDMGAVTCKFGNPADRLVPAVPMPSYDKRYCVDVFGNAWSRAQGQWKKLTPGITSKGYFSITPARNGRYKTQNLHKLVCEAFYGAAPAGLYQVRHLNGDQTDNAPENLDYGTQEQNWADRAAHGKGMGELHHAAKLTDADVAAIRASSTPQRKLAAQYGVTQSTIQSARSGAHWSGERQPAPPNLPRWASRILLEVTEVRVERLQAISDSDCRAEGCAGGHGSIADYQYSATPHEHFRNVWITINGQDSWDANPWVWCLSFRFIAPSPSAPGVVL